MELCELSVCVVASKPLKSKIMKNTFFKCFLMGTKKKNLLNRLLAYKFENYWAFIDGLILNLKRFIINYKFN